MTGVQDGATWPPITDRFCWRPTMVPRGQLEVDYLCSGYAVVLHVLFAKEVVEENFIASTCRQYVFVL